MATFVYKRVEGLEIKMDAWWQQSQSPRPTVVWIHGGALMIGHREWVPGRIRRMVLEAGYPLFSIDYRLAPESKLPAIIEDIEDAMEFIRGEAAQTVPLDPERLGIMGSSAGGYLTLVTGYRVKPRPRVLVSLFGYGDIVGDWYSHPSPHPRHHQVKLTAEEAERQVSGPPVCDPRDRKGDAGAYYQYCRQHGLWPKAVSGWDPHTESERFAPYLPVRNVTMDYPPTILVHGTKDTDVPYEQSVLMANQFQRYSVPHQLVTIDGGEHGLEGGDPARIDAAYASVQAFLSRYLEA
jgi:acetyl esterase/lipase